VGKIYNKEIYTSLRKQLRNSATPAEWMLWNEVKEKKLGYKFRRQYGIDRYIVDFCCKKRRVIIELDGAVHDSLSAKAYDEVRTEFFEALNFTVLRFKNEEVLNNLEAVLKTISKHLK